MLTETLAVFLLCGTLISASSDKKNVLLIIVDDLRPEIGPYAGRDDAFNNPLMGTDKEDTITPNIDDLGKFSHSFLSSFFIQGWTTFLGINCKIFGLRFFVKIRLIFRTMCGKPI